MKMQKELKEMLKLSESMLEKHKSSAYEQLNLIDKNKEVSSEDKSFAKSMGAQLDSAMRNGDSNAFKSIISQLNDKITNNYGS